MRQEIEQLLEIVGKKDCYNINHHNYQDAIISEGATVTVYVTLQQINPIGKIVELYEYLPKSEREKIELLKNK